MYRTHVMEQKVVFILTLAALSEFALGKILAPKLKLNDGKEIPAIALGTWLGNNTKEIKLDKREEIKYYIFLAWPHRAVIKRGRARRVVPREELFITTKLWNDRHARNAVVPALRESLQKLGLDYIDLYLIHWPVGQFANSSYDYTDYVETWRGMMDAKQQGLAKSIGLSNFNEQMIDRIIENDLELPAVQQVEINLNNQQPELLKYCKDKNIIVMGYTPFGSLFYNKAKKDAPPPRIDDPTLVKIANKYNKTVPQVVLRYLIELGVVPIPKSLTKSRIEQNLDVLNFQLTEEEKSLLKAFDSGYRTILQLKWFDNPYYPFKKTINRK